MPEEHANNEEYVIAHATDLEPDAVITFDHAYGLAHQSGGRLVTIHVAEVGSKEDAPDPKQVLAGLSTPEGTVAHDVVVELAKKNPKKKLVATVRELNPDLLILATRQQSGEQKSFRSSISEVAALDLKVPTLVLHVGQPGIVEEGELKLRRILLPVGDGAETRDAIAGLVSFLERHGVDDVDIFMLRVGDDEVLDYLTVPERKGWRFHREVKKQGFVADTVAEVCEEKEIDLIAMASRGQDGLVDVFSGTHTQKVIRRAPRPVLAIVTDDSVGVDDPLP